MRIVAVHFGSEWIWLKMRDGFIKSASRFHPVIMHDVDSPADDGKRKKLRDNNYKLKFWRDLVHMATEPMVLMDTDTIVLDSIEGGFSDQDLTFTSRPGKWLNGGVVFVKPTDYSRAFFDEWVRVDEWLYQGKEKQRATERLMKAWRETGVKGQNQTALALMKDKWKWGWADGMVYNSCQPNMWGNRKEKVIHVKDRLQMDVMTGQAYEKRAFKKIISFY